MPKQKPNCININKLKKITKHKEIAKEKADKKSYVKSSNLQVGDRVLCRQQRKDKITPPFNPKPYVVTTIKSSQVIAENDTRVIKRHITHFKKLRGTSGRQTIDITESRILKWRNAIRRRRDHSVQWTRIRRSTTTNRQRLSAKSKKSACKKQRRVNLYYSTDWKTRSRAKFFFLKGWRDVMYTVYIVAIRRGKYPLYITTTYCWDISNHCLSFQVLLWHRQYRRKTLNVEIKEQYL